MSNLKTRKWYSAATIKPDRKYGLIVQTDMGYIFEAVYEKGLFLVSERRNGKVYFEPSINQDSIVRFMKV